MTKFQVVIFLGFFLHLGITLMFFEVIFFHLFIKLHTLKNSVLFFTQCVSYRGYNWCVICDTIFWECAWFNRTILIIKFISFTFFRFQKNCQHLCLNVKFLILESMEKTQNWSAQPNAQKLQNVYLLVSQVNWIDFKFWKLLTQNKPGFFEKEGLYLYHKHSWRHVGGIWNYWRNSYVIKCFSLTMILTIYSTNID